jgi:hypothetical protein
LSAPRLAEWKSCAVLLHFAHCREAAGDSDAFALSAPAGEDADYVVRLRWRSFRLRKPCGAKFDLIMHLQNTPKNRNVDDVRALIEGAGDAHSRPLSEGVVMAERRSILLLRKEEG